MMKRQCGVPNLGSPFLILHDIFFQVDCGSRLCESVAALTRFENHGLCRKGQKMVYSHHRMSFSHGFSPNSRQGLIKSSFVGLSVYFKSMLRHNIFFRDIISVS